MANKRSKRYKKALEMVEPERLYDLPAAIDLVKKFPGPTFDGTVTLSFKLGVDPKQSDQMVRGTCPLPHGSGKEVKVAVFATGEAATAAKNAGAEFVGYENLIKQVVNDGFNDFDVAIATPEAMAEVRKLGKQLGPRGLMPNPKTGTVTDDTASAIAAVKAGRIDFKLDKNGNVAVAVGKASFDTSQLLDNANAVIDALNASRPATAKGNFLETITVASSMTPGVAVDPSPHSQI